jgi:hypothetical protein
MLLYPLNDKSTTSDGAGNATFVVMVATFIASEEQKSQISYYSDDWHGSCK